MKKYAYVISLLAVVLIFSGCAHHVDIQKCTDAAATPGFWWGLWNGMTFYFSAIGELFSDTIVIYDKSGAGMYDFGFVVGVAFGFWGIVKIVSNLIVAALR